MIGSEKSGKYYLKLQNTDFSKLFKYPLLPMIEPSNMLICLDMDNPPLHVPENGDVLYPILVKLKVRFTNKIFPDNVCENLKKCVAKYTSINIINALGRACSSTMEQLFDKDDLEKSDYENIRRFIKEEIDTLIGK